jgi:hypothetical protein
MEQRMEEKELSEIVGYNNVLDDLNTLEEYSKDFSFVPHIRPKGIVRPGNTDEVQGVVRWANKTRTALVPISSGAPHFRGDTVPGVHGAVILDLSRMKKIIRIDPRNRVTMVEPGVTFGELQLELAKVGLSAYMPLVPRNTKSVIGSMLEREPITSPNHHWDGTDPMLCAEIIFGTGDKLRTGEAAGPDTIEEQWKIGNAQMNPYGISQMNENELVSGAQGTIGIITWATMKCRSLSKLKRAFLIPSINIAPLIDLTYKMVRSRLGDNFFILNGLNLACLLSRSPQEIQELRNILPTWAMFVSFDGYEPLPEEQVEYQEADMMEMADSYGLMPTTMIPGASAEELSRLLAQPSPEPFWKLRFKGGFHDIFFLTTLDKTNGFVATMSDLAQRYQYSAKDIGVYIQATVQGTSSHCEFNLYYDPTKPAESEATNRFVNQGAEALANMGAFFSRPYGAWKDTAYRRVTDTLIMQRKVKQIFDPNSILNPGKLCF